MYFSFLSCFPPIAKCIAEIGHQADKAGPLAPVVGEYSKLGSCREHVELPCIGFEFHNYVLPLY